MITAPRSPQYAFSVPIISWKFTRRRLRIVLDGKSPGEWRRKSGSRGSTPTRRSPATRASSCVTTTATNTTFKEEIARQAVAAEGRPARIEFHQQQRGEYTNVYLDGVEPVDDEAEHRDGDEAAWEVAVEAAPWLVGTAEP